MIYQIVSPSDSKLCSYIFWSTICPRRSRLVRTSHHFNHPTSHATSSVPGLFTSFFSIAGPTENDICTVQLCVGEEEILWRSTHVPRSSEPAWITIARPAMSLEKKLSQLCQNNRRSEPTSLPHHQEWEVCQQDRCWCPPRWASRCCPGRPRGSPWGRKRESPATSFKNLL